MCCFVSQLSSSLNFRYSYESHTPIEDMSEIQANFLHATPVSCLTICL